MWPRYLRLCSPPGPPIRRLAVSRTPSQSAVERRRMDCRVRRALVALCQLPTEALCFADTDVGHDRA